MLQRCAFDRLVLAILQALQARRLHARDYDLLVLDCSS
jgi:hypothetical protein